MNDIDNYNGINLMWFNLQFKKKTGKGKFMQHLFI